jgi:transcriptional regulator with XRE-family HTH domain
MDTVLSDNDPEFMADLDLVARGLPGKGQALRRIFKRSKVTFQQVASHIALTRPAISQWCAEKRWLDSKTLLKALSFLPIDRKVLRDASTILTSEKNSVMTCVALLTG